MVGGGMRRLKLRALPRGAAGAVSLLALALAACSSDTGGELGGGGASSSDTTGPGMPSSTSTGDGPNRPTRCRCAVRRWLTTASGDAPSSSTQARRCQVAGDDRATSTSSPTSASSPRATSEARRRWSMPTDLSWRRWTAPCWRARSCRKSVIVATLRSTIDADQVSEEIKRRVIETLVDGMTVESHETIHVRYRFSPPIALLADRR